MQVPSDVLAAIKAASVMSLGELLSRVPASDVQVAYELAMLVDQGLVKFVDPPPNWNQRTRMAPEDFLKIMHSGDADKVYVIPTSTTFKYYS